MEYNVRNSGDNIFKQSLRNEIKSPVKYFNDPSSDKADITTYLNWKSTNGAAINAKHLKIQKDVTKRLTTGSPSREHTINYVIGTGEVGQVKKDSVASYQGYNQSYKGLLSADRRYQNNDQGGYNSFAFREQLFHKKFGKTIS